MKLISWGAGRFQIYSKRDHLFPVGLSCDLSLLDSYTVRESHFGSSGCIFVQSHGSVLEYSVAAPHILDDQDFIRCSGVYGEVGGGGEKVRDTFKAKLIASAGVDSFYFK